VWSIIIYEAPSPSLDLGLKEILRRIFWAVNNFSSQLLLTLLRIRADKVWHRIIAMPIMEVVA